MGAQQWALVAVVVFGLPLLLCTALPQNVLCVLALTGAALAAAHALWSLAAALLGAVLIHRRPPASLEGGRAVTLIIPAFFDNEAELLHDTLEAYTQIEYRGPLTVMLVHNSGPGGECAEAQNALTAEWDNTCAGSTLFRIIPNPGSCSQAENLAQGLSLLDKTCNYVGFFSADQHPDPHSVQRAVAVLQATGGGVVQGRRTVSNAQDSWVAGLVAAQTEEHFGIGAVAAAHVSGLGMRSDSCCFWDAQLLRGMRFEAASAAPVADAVFNAAVAGANVQYCPQVACSELAPVQVHTAQQQALRRHAAALAMARRQLLPVLAAAAQLPWRQRLAALHAVAGAAALVQLLGFCLLATAVYLMRAKSIESNLLMGWAGVVLLGWLRAALVAFFSLPGDASGQNRPHMAAWAMLLPISGVLSTLWQMAVYGNHMVMKSPATSIAPLHVAVKNGSQSLPPACMPAAELTESERRSGVGYLLSPATPRERASGSSNCLQCLGAACGLLEAAVRAVHRASAPFRIPCHLPRASSGQSNLLTGMLSCPGSAAVVVGEPGESRPRRRSSYSKPALIPAAQPQPVEPLPAAMLEKFRKPSFIAGLYDERGDDASMERTDSGMREWIAKMCRMLMATEAQVQPCVSALESLPESPPPSPERSEVEGDEGLGVGGRPIERDASFAGWIDEGAAGS